MLYSESTVLILAVTASADTRKYGIPIGFKAPLETVILYRQKSSAFVTRSCMSRFVLPRLPHTDTTFGVNPWPRTFLELLWVTRL